MQFYPPHHTLKLTFLFLPNINIVNGMDLSYNAMLPFLLESIPMSRYQYYYFEAVDRLLTDAQQKELRAISTRADIDSRSFVNEYQWGNLKADPLKLMRKYFDIHLYYANWGTRVIMFKSLSTRICG